jgi:hypothetical protein
MGSSRDAASVLFNLPGYRVVDAVEEPATGVCRAVDASWAHRRLLLHAGDTLSKAGLARLWDTFRRDDPTDELGAAWGVKEQLRRLLKTSSLEHAHGERMRLGVLVAAVDMPETDRLWNTITV